MDQQSIQVKAGLSLTACPQAHAGAYLSTLPVYKDTSPSKVTLLPPPQGFLVLILTLGFVLQEMGSDVAVYRNQA